MRTLSENFDILLVEDNAADQYLLEQMLLSSRLGINKIYVAVTIKEALELLKTTLVNLVLLDLTLPDSFGIDSLKSIKTLIQRIPVIILTGLSDDNIALEALKEQAQDYLVKGEINSHLLIKSIEYSIERKKAEESIVASEEKYRHMFYRNPFPMWVSDEHSLEILEVNDAATQKYGYNRDEFLTLKMSDIEVDEITCPQLAEAVITIHGMEENLRKHRKKNGEIMVVECCSCRIDYHGKTAIQAQISDITENLRLEYELSSQKQQLVEAVLNAQELERKTIGGALHDNINQVLTAVKLNLGLALEYQDNTTIIVNCKKNIETVMNEIRNLTKQLILPGNLKEIGLVQSIQDLMKEVLQHTGISWKVFAKGVNENLLSEEQKLTVYRIVQEQLNNVLKHSEASSVAITLGVSREKVRFRIVDNGKGFDVKQKRNGIGLTNIINRASLFNGKVNIDSTFGQGCSLEVELKSKQLLQ